MPKKRDARTEQTETQWDDANAPSQPARVDPITDGTHMPDDSRTNRLMSVAEELTAAAQSIEIQRFIVDTLLHEDNPYIDAERWYKIYQTDLRSNTCFMTWCVLNNWPDAHNVYTEDGDTKFTYDGLQMHIRSDDVTGIKVVAEVPDAWALSSVEPFMPSIQVQTLKKCFELFDFGASWMTVSDLWYREMGTDADRASKGIGRWWRWYRPFGGRYHLKRADRHIWYDDESAQRAAYEQQRHETERIRNYVVSNIARMDAGRMRPFTDFAGGIGITYQVGVTEYEQREWDDFRANLIGTVGVGGVVTEPTAAV